MKKLDSTTVLLSWLLTLEAPQVLRSALILPSPKPRSAGISMDEPKTLWVSGGPDEGLRAGTGPKIIIVARWQCYVCADYAEPKFAVLTDLERETSAAFCLWEEFS